MKIKIKFLLFFYMKIIINKINKKKLKKIFLNIFNNIFIFFHKFIFLKIAIINKLIFIYIQ